MAEQKYDLTTGDIRITFIKFVIPYLLSCFMQTFYGLADLFIVGMFKGSETTTAVSIGSQVMHMITVMIVGLSMGATVELGHCIGAKNYTKAKRITGNTVILFAVIAAVITVILVSFTGGITSLMMTPVEAINETNSYLKICFWGTPFVIAYNVVCSVYRGAGDSRRPMIFVGIACFINILLDMLFIGGFGFGAAGAAYGTVIGQAISFIVALVCLRTVNAGYRLDIEDLRPRSEEIKDILKVGFPISMQDGLIQIAFVSITVIANSRGLIDSVSVGVVEKIISFLFLVNSASLSALSAVTAQNIGAGKPKRAREALKFAMMITVSWATLCFLYCQIAPDTLIVLFRSEPEIVEAAVEYLRPYSADCIFAAVHFCFSGYFCGCQKSGISFLHNILSVVLIRVPGAYLASKLYPDTLFPMGLAAPIGSLFSVCICIVFYIYYRNKEDLV